MAVGNTRSELCLVAGVGNAWRISVVLLKRINARNEVCWFVEMGNAWSELCLVAEVGYVKTVFCDSLKCESRNITTRCHLLQKRLPSLFQIQLSWEYPINISEGITSRSSISSRTCYDLVRKFGAYRSEYLVKPQLIDDAGCVDSVGTF
ncbi:hypothetical protein AVEN_231480-1 [Araneus ventricosus]|uniref:Uncharacterized protein n=1 Tax=Araneus ventricosus TaxID=182803 RepID=A0A4Y2IW16_ARAVE|nr:hypothetical protein AVEN_231480-1 [Araneus ventricosus]